MIIERRRYRLNDGCAPAFWDAQRVWNRTELVLGLAQHNLCYLHRDGPGDEAIVHLYAWPSLDDWQAAYDRIYAGHPQEYFDTVRPLFRHQETSFLKPLQPTINPLPWGERPRPDQIVEARGLDCATLRVTEEMVQLWPAAVSQFLAAFGELAGSGSPLVHEGLMGSFQSFVGSLGRVFQYRWFADDEAIDDHFEHRRSDRAWSSFEKAIEPAVSLRRHSRLGVSPLWWQRAMFARPDWSRFVASS